MISRFRWQIENKLAGMGRPLIGRKDVAPVCGDAEFLENNGVTAIVSLTETPLDADALGEWSFEYRHFPIPDGSRPTLSEMREIIEAICRLIDAGATVAVHCAAGLGRTGTVLALYLVHSGMTAREAIAAVREREPMAIENVSQEEAVGEYEGFLEKAERRRKT
jgi:atypical dual specificity phosphatase